MPTQAERRAATTAGLLKTARKLFADEGYTNVSIDQIASAAGVTRGALYHHFPSKEAVFEYLVREIQDELRTRVLGAVDPADDPRTQIVVGCRRFIELAADPTRLRILLVDGPAVLGWARFREIDQAFFLEPLRLAVRRMHPDAPEPVSLLTAQALLAACSEIALAHGAGEVDSDAVDAVLDRLVG